ncbi:MAG: hypothetical protein ACI3V0_12270, partial [Faecousia sp.]
MPRRERKQLGCGKVSAFGNKTGLNVDHNQASGLAGGFDENAPGDALDFVLWNTGLFYDLLFAAQAGCSLRFDMKFLRCS